MQNPYMLSRFSISIENFICDPPSPPAMSVITTKEASSLLSKLKGKKRLVAKLLREGGYTDERIAA